MVFLGINSENKVTISIYQIKVISSAKADRKAMDLIMNKEQNKDTKKLPGFYIAVCCCVLAIGAAGYFTQKSETKHTSKTLQNIEDKTDDKIVSTIPPTKIPTHEAEQGEIFTPAPTVPLQASHVIPIDDFAADNPDLEASVTVNAEEALSFTKPTPGEIIASYSDKPVYNEALDDWRCHNGIDIAVNEGGSVCAAADGQIESIDYNAMGCYVTITHSDGYVTKYMQLESAGEFPVGSQVKKGDVIGVIGKSKAETASQPHLHFEIHQNGDALNPAEAIN